MCDAHECPVYSVITVTLGMLELSIFFTASGSGDGAMWCTGNVQTPLALVLYILLLARVHLRIRVRGGEWRAYTHIYIG